MTPEIVFTMEDPEDGVVSVRFTVTGPPDYTDALHFTIAEFDVQTDDSVRTAALARRDAWAVVMAEMAAASIFVPEP